MGCSKKVNVDRRNHAESGRLCRRSRSARGGFTLVEILVTLGIIAVLISLLAPVLSRTIGLARSHKCQMSLRAVAFDFTVYADDELHGHRGADERTYNGRFFRMQTFIDSQYGAAEFWRYGDAHRVTLPDDAGNDPLRCPEVPGEMRLARGTRCVDGAIETPQNISFGFNMRLHRAEVTLPNGMVGSQQVLLTSEVLTNPNVPLAWDVDGQEAFDRRQRPVLSAPTLESEAVYANDRYWYPSLRHGGSMNVAFLGGHVVNVADPLAQPTWDWSYQGPRHRSGGR